MERPERRGERGWDSLRKSWRCGECEKEKGGEVKFVEVGTFHGRERERGGGGARETRLA